MKQIKTIKQLRSNIDRGNTDFFILLNNSLRSSKSIFRGDNYDDFLVLNQTDESEQVMTEEQLFDRNYTNIGYAMQQGSLYVY